MDLNRKFLSYLEVKFGGTFKKYPINVGGYLAMTQGGYAT
jgi:hypothetical protein